MSYFSELLPEVQKYFTDYGYKPQNNYDATAFFRGIYNVDKNNVLTVNLKPRVRKNNKLVDHINLSAESYLDAFCPVIWNRLNIQQRLHAIVCAFDAIVKRDKTLINARPQLVFDFDLDECGYQYYFNGNFFVHITSDMFLLKNFSPLEVLSTLMHELYHCKQDAMSYQTWQKIKHNKQHGISNKKLDEYFKSLVSNYYGGIFTSCTELISEISKQYNIREHYKKSKSYNKDEYAYLSYFYKIKNRRDWKDLKYIFYILETREQGAYNKEDNFIKTVDNYFSKTFNSYKSKYKPTNSKYVATEILELLNKKYGFKLTEQDLVEFEKINNILKSDVIKLEVDKGTTQKYFGFEYSVPENLKFFKSKTWYCLKHLLEIHKHKCVVNQIPQCYVDDCLNIRDNTMDTHNFYHDTFDCEQ